MLISQSPVQANKVLNAVVSCFGPETRELRIAVAYITLSGTRTLLPALASSTGDKWSTIPKTLITCFDFGHTEPSALRSLREEGIRVYISNLGSGSIRLQPNPSSFHPKIYLSLDDQGCRAVVGSANLTRRALTINTEIMAKIELTDQQPMIDTWNDIMTSAERLSNSLLSHYEALRSSAKPLGIIDEPRAVKTVESDALPVFRESVEAGQLTPNQYTAFWIDAGYLSGGSHNQLELPRLAHRFFGFAFEAYRAQQQEIGRPVLLLNQSRSDDRKLTWHGNNRMERLNLPPPTQNHVDYQNTVILFRKGSVGYHMDVIPHNSNIAECWRSESGAANTLLRVSIRSNRLCGFL